MAKTGYVVGFHFRNGEVALIAKNRPDWQRGRLNGIGGHIEVGETPLEAMSREFQEEAGVRGQLNWRQFCLVYGDSYELYCFASQYSGEPIRTMTDETVGWYSIDHLPDNILSNLRWLIPMANYEQDISATVHHPSDRC
jgi:8-oxo-dGTP diphosphatase